MKPPRKPAVSVWKSRYRRAWCRQIRGAVGVTFHPTWAEAMGLVPEKTVEEPCS